MKRMLVFFSIALFIYGIGNYYLFAKGFSLPALSANKKIYALIFWILAGIFIIAKIIEARHSSVITDVLNVIGGFWLAFMLYGFIFFFLSDIMYLMLRLFGILHDGNILLYRKWAFISICSVTVILIIAGFINAVIPVVKEYNITINKDAGVRSFRIAAVSDIHLGSIIRKRSMRALSRILTNLKPDQVLLLGDIVDGEIGPVMRGDLLRYFNCPKCDSTLIAITGNHEYIGGAKRTIPYIESKGIRLLLDEVFTTKNGIQFIGRKDRDSGRFYGHERMKLADLVAQTDSTKPVILLDHQPVHYDETVKHNIDLELSGHTHNGQMWPLNHITAMLYELSYGYLRKGNSNFIVSSGYGLWGPRVRIGSHSEVMLINITFAGGAVN